MNSVHEPGLGVRFSSDAPIGSGRARGLPQFYNYNYTRDMFYSITLNMDFSDFYLGSIDLLQV